MKKVYFLFAVMCFSATSSVLYAEDYDYLYERIYDDEGKVLSQSQVRSIVDDLRSTIDEKYSYAQLKGIPYANILAEIAARAQDGISLRNLAIQLQQFISLFGDGHARVEYKFNNKFVRANHRADGFLPFGIRKTKNHYVAVDTSSNQFLQNGFPYIKSINGIGIENWLGHAYRFVTNGSETMKNFRALETIHNINFMQYVMNLSKTKSVKVELYNKKGEKKSVKVKLGKKGYQRHKHPIEPVLSIPNNVSYIKIPHMDNDEEAIGKIKDWLDESRNKEGAIIDIRGNSGGRREPLQVILPHVMDPDELPYIATIAAYKMTSRDRLNKKSGYLADRFLFPKTYQGWNENHILSINKFMENFNPKWQLPEQGFSDWHYNMIDPVGNPALFNKKLVILMDDGNFSASDIFLGAFKNRKNVTLIGLPSKGGSARAKMYTLGGGNIKVRLATIASFKRDGNIYDGNPTVPDIIVHPTANYYVGATDKVLSKALKILGAS